jgi:pimeloyl-ACP methyl ester carboxylesterase
VAFDPRGTGETEDPIDCKADQETLGAYRQPFPTPENLDVSDWLQVNKRYIRRCLKLNPKILPYVSTANVARDMDRLRSAVGDRKLGYLGFSYGTFLGATYESLFPHNYRALVLDGALDADKYINRPMLGLREQSSAFERALDRFFQACAANQVACAGFGGDDPHGAFDELVDKLDADPQPASATDPRLVDGNDVLSGALTDLYAKQFWPYIAAALAAAQAGDYAPIRGEADISYGRNPDGTYDPGLDRYFAVGALESATRRTSAPSWTQASTPGRCSITSGGTLATSSCPGASGRSSRAARSTGRSGRRTRPRPRSWWGRPTTRRPPTGAPRASCPSSATRGC